MILAIDPGTTESGYVFYDEHAKAPFEFGIVPNETMLEYIVTTCADRMAVEMIASYGMAVGASTFETCVWIGRFVQQWLHRATQRPWELVTRLEAKTHICHSAKANDSNVTAALADRHGGSVKAAKGTKRSPGPLYGMSGHMWQAYAVAITAAER